jgi:hypothetical protein
LQSALIPFIVITPAQSKRAISAEAADKDKERGGEREERKTMGPELRDGITYVHKIEERRSFSLVGGAGMRVN